MSVAAERTLTERDLNRALLARQLLLERAELPLPSVVTGDRFTFAVEPVGSRL